MSQANWPMNMTIIMYEKITQVKSEFKHTSEEFKHTFYTFITFSGTPPTMWPPTPQTETIQLDIDFTSTNKVRNSNHL